MPGRPTCLTCPYRSQDTDDDGRGEAAPMMRTGVCRRHAPRTAPRRIPDTRDIDPDDLEQFPAWPVTMGTEWCGEHPGFPAYLAERYGAD